MAGQKGRALPVVAAVPPALHTREGQQQDSS